jgi:hypothetical protein
VHWNPARHHDDAAMITLKTLTQVVGTIHDLAF